MYTAEVEFLEGLGEGGGVFYKKKSLPYWRYQYFLELHSHSLKGDDNKIDNLGAVWSPKSSSFSVGLCQKMVDLQRWNVLDMEC